ncbi:MAG: hydroxyethylthiazole kinase [Candidatus Aminicenantia bacterium]
MKDLRERVTTVLKKIRQERPLVHNITNFVVMNYTANALLAIGASPVMAHSADEVEDMVSLAQALVLNIGTLDREWIESMIKAGKRANEIGVPVILDPVGAGATPLRTSSAKKIIKEIKLSSLRGNASEILSLRNDGGKTKGVDSLHEVEEVWKEGVELSREIGSVVAITGKVDFITDGKRAFRCYNGHPMLRLVTGTGCTATVIIGAFLAAERDPLLATSFGLSYFGIAGEKASEKTSSSGSYGIALLDAIYEIKEEEFAEKMRLEEVEI